MKVFTWCVLAVVRDPYKFAIAISVGDFKPVVGVLSDGGLRQLLVSSGGAP